MRSLVSQYAARRQVINRKLLVPVLQRKGEIGKANRGWWPRGGKKPLVLICFKPISQTGTSIGENLVSKGCHYGWSGAVRGEGSYAGATDCSADSETLAPQRRRLVINTLEITFTGVSWTNPLLLLVLAL